MKKIILPTVLALFIALAFIALAGWVQNQDTETGKYEYAIVLHRHNIMVYYGAEKEEDFGAMKNKEYKTRRFANINIMVDALNYMDEQGYVLVSSYNPVSNPASAEDHMHVFRREKQ